MRTKEEVDHAFTYHAPRSGAEIAFYEEYRESARGLAHYLLANLPETADRTIALRKLQEAVMAANLACALHGIQEP